MQHITPQTFVTQISFPTDPFCTKLCSIQTYLQDTLSLHFVLEHLFSWGLDESMLEQSFEFSDFEDISLFLWLVHDTDAHPNNFRVLPKHKLLNGLFSYGIQKIDNGLCFPEKNTDFSLFFSTFPHAEKPLSERIRKKIQSLPLQKIEQRLQEFSLSSRIPAFLERAHLLQQASEKNSITYSEISHLISEINID